LIVVTVVLLSAAGIQFAAAVRQMTLERRVPWGWRRKAPWYVGSAFLSLGIWVGIAVFLHQLLISVQIGFPGRKLILDCLGGLVKWLRQDALADGMVYASSKPKPRETQKAMQDAVKAKVAGFPKTFESIHIVAHSLGSIVTFEVLSSLVSGVALQPKHKKRIRTFFTAGCPLIKFLDVLADDPLTGRVRNFALARVITLSRFLVYRDAGPERSTGTRILNRLVSAGRLTEKRLERVIQSPRVAQLAGTRMLEESFQRGEWTEVLPEVLPDLEDLQKRRGRQPYPKRFDGMLPSKGLPKDFKWCNFVADRDLAPDRLEKKPHFPPPDSVPGKEKQKLENYPGEVEDVHVKSTRGLGAHFAYWDKNCETLRYILEQIDPAVFGQRFHDLALIRKAQLRAAEEPSGMP